MKTSIRIFASVFAASLGLVSCNKVNVSDEGNGSKMDGVRTIAVSFANASVKSDLGEDGFTPKFVGTDVIKVSNGRATEDCTVSIDDSGNAFITTSLIGALTAVYPSSAANMNGNAIEGIIVSTVQDGTFASANICKAEIAAGAESATFKNQTAIFKITPGAGADTKYVEVITAGPEIANSAPSSYYCEYDTKHKIHIASTSAESVYVSILVPSGLRIRDLSFADGSNMKTLKDNTNTIAANTIYTVTNENWNRPYVDVKLNIHFKYKTYKWATMNIGASKPEEYGDYFMWGAVEKAYTSVNVTKQSGAFKFVSANPYGDKYKNTWSASKGFDWNNCLYTDGVYSDSQKNVFTKYTGSNIEYAKSGTADGKTTLDLVDDAANVNWGGSWRMPTSYEYNALETTEYAEHKYEDNGCIFVGPSVHLFFPISGLAYGTGLYYTGEKAYLWSSDLASDGNLYRSVAFGFELGKNPVKYLINRFYGLPVRPISE